MRLLVPKIARAVTAAGLVLTAHSHGWLVNRGRELHGGLLSFDSGGEVWSNKELVAAARANGGQQVSDMYAWAGQALYGLALLAALLLVAAIVAPRRWIQRVTLGVVAVSVVAFGVFMHFKPSGPAFGIDPGWSALVFFIAAWMGVMLSGGLPRRGA